jgi:hypothetical protein
VQRDSFGGEKGRQILERLINPHRNLEHVRPILGRDQKDHAGFAHDECGADCRRPHHVGDILETNAHPVLSGEYGFAQLIRRDRLTFCLNDDPLIPGLDKSRAAHPGRSACRGDYIVDTGAMGEQPGGIDLDLQLTFSATVNRKLGDAGHREQAGTDGPVGKGPKIHW